jgi:serine/threonine protein kinase
MGTVYKAELKGAQRVCAVKVLSPQLVENAESLGRFQREAKLVGSLDHPNIVKIWSAGIDGKTPYIAMELLNGITLSKAYSEDCIKDFRVMIDIFIQSCRALEHAHSKGIIHRDVKPSNIMLLHAEPAETGPEHGAAIDGAADSSVNSSSSTTAKYLIKLVDFGVAKCTEASTAEQKLTRTGTVIGSPVYMSPEQCMAKELDARSDLYSLGCVMYQAVTGSAPFVDDVSTAILFKHLCEEAKPFAQMPAKIEPPPGFEQVVFKAMAKYPEDRYQSASDLADDLQLILDGKTPRLKDSTDAQQRKTAAMDRQKTLSSLPAMVERRRRQLLQVTAGGAIVLTLAAIAIAVPLSRYHRQQESVKLIDQATKLWDDGKAIKPKKTRKQIWNDWYNVPSDSRLLEGISAYMKPHGGLTFNPPEEEELSQVEQASRQKLALQDFEKADTLFQKAGGCDRQRCDLLYLIGQTYLEMKDSNKAYQWFEKAAGVRKKFYGADSLEYSASEDGLGLSCMAAKTTRVLSIISRKNSISSSKNRKSMLFPTKLCTTFFQQQKKPDATISFCVGRRSN